MRPARCYLPRDVVQTRVLDVVRTATKQSPYVSTSSHFTADLKLDSLQRKELLTSIEQEFCIRIPPTLYDSISSVENAVDYISTHTKAR